VSIRGTGALDAAKVVSPIAGPAIAVSHNIIAVNLFTFPHSFR
jgi:hypothetical protein